MRLRVSTLLLVPLLGPVALLAQQKVDIRRPSTSTVSVRLSGPFSSLRIIAWAADSIALTGSLGAGSSVQGAPLNFTGPVTAMKFFVDGAADASVAANRFELRVPRNARVWVKTGSAEIDCAGVAGGLDLNIIGGSIRVNGKPRELLVESMDGTVHFSGYSDYARLKTATGNIVVEGGGEDLSLVTVSGSIQLANGERTLQRARFESVTGPITYSGQLPAGADLRLDSHSGAIEVRLERGNSVEVDASTMTGAIENILTQTRPIAGREGRGMELSTSSGTGSARIQIRSFKGNVRVAPRQ
jgi:hypothetical protein